jgi:hypothetical protein
VLKPNVGLNRTAFGMDFLGYRVFPQGLWLARRSKLRFTRKFRWYECEWVAGRWTDLSNTGQSSEAFYRKFWT